MIVLTAGPRGSGKTEYIVRWLFEDPINRLIIVATNQEREYIMNQYHVPNNSIYTAGYVIEIMTRERRDIAIDDLYRIIHEDSGVSLLRKYSFMIKLVTIYADEVVDLNTNTTEVLRQAMSEVQEKLDE